MNLDRKGFTLIELLGVVVVLLAISVVAISSISAAIERNKEKQNAAKEDIIISYAELYYQSHKNSLGEKGCINIDDLDLSDGEKVDADGNQIIWRYVEYTDFGKNFELIDDVCNP